MQPVRIRPMPGYRGSFTPWPGELVAGARYAPEGCVSSSEGALMLGGRAEIAREVAGLVGCSRQLVAAWQTGERYPSEEHRQAMEEKLGIPAVAWGLWRPVGGAVAVEEPPPSERRRVEERDSSPPPASDAAQLPTSDVGSVLERARALLAYLAVPGRTKAELDQAKEIRASMTFEARLVGAMQAKAKLHEHPDWPAFQAELVRVLSDVPGGLEALERIGTESDSAA